VRFRLVLALIGSALLGSTFIGCSGGSSDASHPTAGALPAAPAGEARQAAGTRRTLSVGCTTPGTSAFAGGGVSNIAGGTYSAVVAGSGNQSCGLSTVIGGGTSNTIAAQNAGNPVTNGFIGGGESNLIMAFTDGFIGAGSTNTVTGPRAAIVSGSGNSVAATDAILASGEGNTISVSGTMGFIGDGSGNSVTNGYGVVMSGNNNSVSGQYGVIGSGINNTVSGEGGYIASGGYNNVAGEGAVIVGGFNSTAGGNFATVPGGYVNSAAGTYSFAAGARASAANTGTFVWSDGSDGDAILTSSRNYQFLARAAGGFTLWTNAASTVGAMLAPGSGTWASASDRNLKTDVAGIDDDAVLDKVASLPISRWSYKSERGVSHVGPMAQDFYAAFKLGQDDKHITSIDEDGVALAAIKALHAENRSVHAENAHLRSRLAAVEASQSSQIADLKRELVRLSEAVATLHRK
jgi:hypothetical protein